MNSSQKKKYLVIVITLIVLLLLCGVVFSRFFEIDQVSDTSMSPAYAKGEYILVQKLNRTFKVGDVLMFNAGSGTFGIERIIAVPGDTIIETPTTLTTQGTTYTFPALWEVPTGTGVISSETYVTINDTRTSPPQILPLSDIIGSAVFPKP